LLAAATAPDTIPLSQGTTLGLLLSVEGFLLAAITLTVALAAPDQTRQPKYPNLHPEALRFGALAVLWLIAVGALVAWASIFTGGDFRGLAVGVEAGALLVAVVGQPIIALFLALAARRA